MEQNEFDKKVRDEFSYDKEKEVMCFLKKYLAKIEQGEIALASTKKKYDEYINMSVDEVYQKIAGSYS